MEAVKRSIYLDADLVEPLRRSADEAGRSQTKQLNMILRNALLHEQAASATPLPIRMRPAHALDLSRPARPDPKVTKKRSAKKLT